MKGHGGWPARVPELGLLDDTPGGWKRVAGWRLAGVRIEAVAGLVGHAHSRWSAEQRLELLRQDATGSRGPFLQITGLYRQAGHTATKPTTSP